MTASVAASLKAFTTTPGTTLESATITPSGSGRILYVLVGSGSGSGGVLPTSVKYGGSGVVDMAVLDSKVEAPYWAAALYRLVNPSAAGGTIHVTWPSTQEEMWCIAVAVQDADADGTPNGTVVEGYGTTSQPSTVKAPSVENDLVLDFTSFFHGGGGGGVATEGAGQTAIQKLDNSQINAYEGAITSYEIATGASTTMSWSYSVTPGAWLVWALNVNSAIGGGAEQPQIGVRELRNLKRTFRPRPFAPG